MSILDYLCNKDDSGPIVAVARPQIYHEFDQFHGSYSSRHSRSESLFRGQCD